MKIYTTEKIDKLNLEYHTIKRSEKFNYRNILNTRKSGLNFVFTNEELIEYAKCANDPIYFIEKYCKNHNFSNIQLRDYQKYIANEFKDNRFIILASSRQSGIDFLMKLLFLHYMIFNSDKTIYILSDKLNSKFIDDIKFNYCALPFFLKQGVNMWNKYTLGFENGMNIIMISSIHAIGNTPNLLYIKDFVYIKNVEEYYANIIPTISSIKDSKVIIKSIFKDNKFFNDLVYKSELPNGNPEKNLYKTIRVYWWQYMTLAEKEDLISIIGEDSFKEQYELVFKK